MAKKQDTLFPEKPEDLSALSDEDLEVLLQEHNVAAELIEANDEEFTKGLEADELYAEYEKGVEQIEAIKDEQKARVAQQEEFNNRMSELAKRRKGDDDEEEEAEEAADEETVEVSVDVEQTADETSTDDDEDDDEDAKKAEDKEAVVAAAASKSQQMAVKLRRPPSPALDRMPASDRPVLTAAAGVEGIRVGGAIHDRMELAQAMKVTANRWGRVAKHDAGVEQRILIANATFNIPEERKLHASDWQANQDKIRQVIPESMPGIMGVPMDRALVASGGLCAPLEPIYTMPNFASLARPVRDALPTFQADRGGVNVPTATYIADITTAITVITEDEDALGGTFATKSCQALDCPAYTETAVTVISHCREYGNLNAMAWPEKIAHENDLTMAAHARTAESYLLSRIKAQSINVTNGAETLGALIYLVDAVVKAKFGIMGRLRMDRNARFRALLPFWLPDMLALDTVQTIDGNRFRSEDELVAYLRSFRIDPVFYLDTADSGTTQLPDSSQTAAALDGLPDKVEWALFPEGAFIHVDSGSLELGIVRDSTLNSTNDYQIFGETFENVARIAPEQATYWVVSDVCPTGQFPPAGTARTCE